MRNVPYLSLLILLAACGDGKLLQPEELGSPEMGLGPEVLADGAEVKLVPLMAQSSAANVKQDFHVQVFFTRTVEAGEVRFNSAGMLFGYDLINEFESVGDLNGFWYFQGKYKLNPNNGKGLSIASPALWVINESEWGTGTFECNNSFRIKNWPTDDFLQYGNMSGCEGTGDFEGMKLKGFLSNENDPGLFVDSVYDMWGEIW